MASFFVLLFFEHILNFLLRDMEGRCHPICLTHMLFEAIDLGQRPHMNLSFVVLINDEHEDCKGVFNS